MRHNEQNYDSDYQSQRHGSQGRNEDSDLSNFQSRYAQRGNYYGMPDQGHEYHNVRNQGNTYDNASGSGGDYGASSRRGSYDQNDRHIQGQMHQNEWGSSGQGSGRSSQQDHYHYGDPNPYMNNQRNRSNEGSFGTDWRNEDVDHANRRYSRQENSYRHTGHGRRFDQYGQDEHYNYSHGQQDGRRSIQDSESLDDRYIDRGDHSRPSSANDYGQQYGSNYDHRNRNSQGRNDNYETRSFQDRSSGRSQGSDDFDHTSGDYPSRSPKGYGQRSGPDYSASSPITNYGPGVRGYQK